MRHFKSLTAAALMGSAICLPAIAQQAPDLAPRWTAEEAGMVTEFEAMRLGAPSRTLASETALKSLLSNLPDLISVEYGGFDVEDDGTVAKDVELTFGADLPLGIRIGELRVFGLDDDQLVALAANETAEIGTRIDMRNVELFGLEQLADLATETYLDQLEGAIEGLTEEDVSATSDINYKINSYELSVGQIIIDGFVWHETPEGVDAGIASLFSTDGPPEGSEAWALFAPLARFYRSFEADNIAYYDTRLAMDMDSSTDGLDQTMVLDVNMPLAGLANVERGDVGLIFYRDMTASMSSNMKDPESDFEMPMQFGSSIDLVLWEGIKLSKLFSYLERQDVPSTDVKDLMSLGKATAYGERARMGDKEFYSVGKGIFDMSKWEWFIPENLSFAAQDYTINLGDYLGWVKDIASPMIETSDDAADSAEAIEVFNAITSVLDENDLNTVNMDFAFDYAWNAETGKTGIALSHDLDGFGRLNFAFALGAVTFDDAVAVMTPDADAGMAEFDPSDAFGELFAREASLEGFEIMLDDDGGMEKLFNIAVAFAKLAPEDNQQAAMLRNSTPEDLRQFVSAMTRMTGFQAASVFPPAVDYINGFADFIAEGGKLNFKMAPDKPLTAEDLETIMPMLETPDEAVEYLGLEFEYTAPEDK